MCAVTTLRPEPAFPALPNGEVEHILRTISMRWVLAIAALLLLTCVGARTAGAVRITAEIFLGVSTTCCSAPAAISSS